MHQIHIMRFTFFLKKFFINGLRFDGVKDLTDAGDIIGVTGTIKRTEKGIHDYLLEEPLLLYSYRC